MTSVNNQRIIVYMETYNLEFNESLSMLKEHLGCHGLSDVVSESVLNQFADMMVDHSDEYKCGIMDAALNLAGLISDGEEIGNG